MEILELGLVLMSNVSIFLRLLFRSSSASMHVRLKRGTDQVISCFGKLVFPEKQIQIGKEEYSRFRWSLARTILPNPQNVSAHEWSGANFALSGPRAWLGRLAGLFLLIQPVLILLVVSAVIPNVSPFWFVACCP